MEGIKRHKIVADTPRQNGLVGMNITFIERVRCMILGARLSKSFWRKL